MKRQLCILSILILATALPAAATGINSSIHIESGMAVDDDLSTLNGKIRIDDGSTVQGSVIVEDEDLEVEVYLRGGIVAGEIRGATVIEK